MVSGAGRLPACLIDSSPTQNTSRRALTPHQPVVGGSSASTPSCPVVRRAGNDVDEICSGDRVAPGFRVSGSLGCPAQSVRPTGRRESLVFGHTGEGGELSES